MNVSGGPAFPTPRKPNSTQGGDPGMSLRDYFAAAALQRLCSSGLDATNAQTDSVRRTLALTAYGLAESMIAERKRRQGG